MLRRFSTQFKRNKDSNGDAEAKGKDSKRFSKATAARKSVSTDDNHQVKRAEVVAVFEKYAQAIHASQEPLPNQTGDSTFLKHDQSSGLFDDIKTLGFRDINTVKDLIKNKASGELIDDKTYLMERIIQVPIARFFFESCLMKCEHRILTYRLYRWLLICPATRRTASSSPASSSMSSGTPCLTPLSRKNIRGFLRASTR